VGRGRGGTSLVRWIICSLLGDCISAGTDQLAWAQGSRPATTIGRISDMEDCYLFLKSKGTILNDDGQGLEVGSLCEDG
jgi:hypothetical protein